MTAPGEGFDVRPDELRAGTAALRGDAGDLVAACRAASAAIASTAGACGTEPLASAAARFGQALDGAGAAVSTRVTDAAASLEASASAYVTGDGGVAGGLGPAAPGAPPVLLPGLGGN
ncbi:excreted virulence factor EspC (type VII ESX diderm) [Actinomycetospora succinea]|uniref:Excreted virulence factor EspC (Type VII ESX diderm) n=1 Tax=Actinomycetospora succinea TaxID=663603 RepID=A0A4R6V6N0_9PSEU|nr:type VII secretion target [Actinomycetospora succinea]TDQ54127.1 excreted virulence factor EspC (type VII ESX diderm) [Actinomycetospora succinea]